MERIVATGRGGVNYSALTGGACSGIEDEAGYRDFQNGAPDMGDYLEHVAVEVEVFPSGAGVPFGY